MAEQKDHSTTSRLEQIRAVKLCLDELGRQVECHDLGLAANLIGAAARALEDELYETEVKSRALNELLERTYNA